MIHIQIRKTNVTAAAAKTILATIKTKLADQENVTIQGNYIEEIKGAE